MFADAQPGAILGYNSVARLFNRGTSIAAFEGRRNERTVMLWTIAVILVILWLLGVVTSYTIGGFVHILLVLAIVMVLIRVIQGRRVL